MKQRPNQLWIIDIDGTIIDVHNNQVKAWLNMFKDVYDISMAKNKLVTFFGKPFTSVLVDALASAGINEQSALQKFDQAFAGYVQGVQKGLEKRGGKILPGALEFLDELGHRGIVRAIATGNPSEEAEHKLKYFNLLPYFEITIYAGNKREREELVWAAVEEAKQKFNILPAKKEIKIIGDSPHDMRSAQALRAMSIGVATGPTPYEKLAETKPDLIYHSLKNYREIIDQASKL